VTIQDVAAAAGVSGPTVSNVLNGTGRVGEAARARVLEAAAELGYQPHHGAQSLRSRRTRQFAYMPPPDQSVPGSYIMRDFLQALAAASGRQGHNLVLVVPHGDPRDEMRRLIASRSVDAFLLAGIQPDDPRVALLAQAGMPFACFGRTGPALPPHWVDIDNRAAVVTAVDHVLARGFSRVAFVGYRPKNQWDRERAAGFRAGLAAHGLAAGGPAAHGPAASGPAASGPAASGPAASGLAAEDADLLLVDEASARRRIRSLLTGARRGAGPHVRPDAIVTGSDRLAAIVYGVAADLRLRVGRDLAVTGFDGGVATELMHPRLTSVTIPIDDIAERVIDLALRQVAGEPGPSAGEVVAASLRVGESTGDGEYPNLVLDDSVDQVQTLNELYWKRFHETERSVGLPAPAGRRVTIAEVAADAGVGVGTVSRVLNGSGQVRAGTRRAVQDSIDRLGYRPNHAAATLVRGTPRTVAILVTRPTGPSVVVRVASALAVLAEEGYDTIVCNVETPSERDRHLAALLPTHRADGVLAISVPLSREQLAQFARAGVALVTVDATAQGVPQTIIDNVAGGRLATEHLIGLGHRRIGFVGDMVSDRPPAGLGFTSSADRLRGYRLALDAAGIGYRAELIRRGPYSTATAAEHAAELLKSATPPSAIFAASDTQAIGVLAAADRLGVAVPGELSVIGFDDIEYAAFLGLSTVRQPLERSGAEGARRLCALLRGETITPRRQELPLELIARTSTARRQVS
jgi:DNA-binding LacI/PurR family transcriptional regulator